MLGFNYFICKIPLHVNEATFRFQLKKNIKDLKQQQLYFQSILFAALKCDYKYFSSLIAFLMMTIVVQEF